jgi:hypothetical protein
MLQDLRKQIPEVIADLTEYPEVQRKSKMRVQSNAEALPD